MGTLGYLPDELMIEILSLLPPESLLRFKSVCKSWYALINHPKFVRKHFNNSPQRDHVLVKRRMLLKCPKPQYTGQMENTFSVDRFDYFLNVDFPLDDNVLNFEICSHSHGLLCLSNMRGGIFLWNPTTREFRELPPSILLHLTEDLDGYDSFTNVIGFGYDPKSKDFKVVRVVDFDGLGYIHYPRVEIYDLSKDRWREIECPVYGNAPWLPYFETYHEGTYFWWVDAYESSELIQTFDMSEEVFGTISIPEEVKEQHNIDINSGVLNGSVVFIIFNEDRLDIWEIQKDESAGGFSWSRLLIIDDPVFTIVEPLLFVNSDELLIVAEGGPVILYNIKTQHFKQLSIKGGDPLRFQPTFYVKSLVSVKGGMNGF